MYVGRTWKTSKTQQRGNKETDSHPMSTFKLDDLRGNVSVKSLCSVARQLMAMSIRSMLTCSLHATWVGVSGHTAT